MFYFIFIYYYFFSCFYIILTLAVPTVDPYPASNALTALTVTVVIWVLSTIRRGFLLFEGVLGQCWYKTEIIM